MQARGVIFDLDGTMVDNMGLHAEAFAIFALRHGLPPLTADDRVRLDGKRNRDIFPILFGGLLGEKDLQEFAQQKESLYRDLSGGKLHPLPGLLRFLDLLQAEGIPVAIATSAPAENVVHNLTEIGLVNRLTRIVRSDEVAHGKPALDVFLAAAHLIGVAPADCLAFEDSPAGLQAARGAGMACAAVTTSFDAETLASHGAAPDVAVPHYDAFLRGAGMPFLGPALWSAAEETALSS